MRRHDDRWARPEAGQTLREYGIVLAVIVLARLRGRVRRTWRPGGQFQAVIAVV
jgi:hypothetical protein